MIFPKVLPASWVPMLLSSLTSATEGPPTNPAGLPADQWNRFVAEWVKNMGANDRVKACLYSRDKQQRRMDDQVNSDVAGQRKTLSQEMSKFPEYRKLILYTQISEKEAELQRLHEELRELERPTPLGNIIKLIKAFAPADAPNASSTRSPEREVAPKAIEDHPKLNVPSSEQKIVDMIQKRLTLFELLWNRDRDDFPGRIRYVAERYVRLEVIDKLLGYQNDHREVTKQLRDNVDVNGKAYLRDLFAGGTWQNVYRRVGFPINDPCAGFRPDQISATRAKLAKLEAKATQNLLKIYDGLKQPDKERMNDLLYTDACFRSFMKFLKKAQASDLKSA